MYFTLLFESPEGPTEIYELVFHPCPVWFRGGAELGTDRKNEICIPTGGPHYVTGDFGVLLKHVKINNKVPEQPPGIGTTSRKVAIICHESGHGSDKDLLLLIDELKSEGFIPQFSSVN